MQSALTVGNERRGGSLRTLLHLRGQKRLFALALGLGLLGSWLGLTRLNLPLWGAALGVLALLSYPAAANGAQTGSCSARR